MGECKAFGTSIVQFLDIIEKEGAKNIENKAYKEVSFVIENLLFQTGFENPVCGLSRISVSEFY